MSSSFWLDVSKRIIQKLSDLRVFTKRLGFSPLVIEKKICNDITSTSLTRFILVWNLITPILDPVVASKIVFTKNVEELEEYIAPDSLPIVITGDASRPALDDQELKHFPVAGSRLIPSDTPNIKLYWDTIDDFESKTEAWAKVPEFGGDEDALNRLRLGQNYRVTRVKAEKHLRGETSYHTKGLITIDDNDRLLINYNTSTWDKKDITDWV